MWASRRSLLEMSSPGLVPVIPIGEALCHLNRDGRDKPGHDNAIGKGLTCPIYDYIPMSVLAAMFHEQRGPDPE